MQTIGAESLAVNLGTNLRDLCEWESLRLVSGYRPCFNPRLHQVRAA